MLSQKLKYPILLVISLLLSSLIITTSSFTAQAELPKPVQCIDSFGEIDTDAGITCYAASFNEATDGGTPTTITFNGEAYSQIPPECNKDGAECNDKYGRDNSEAVYTYHESGSNIVKTIWHTSGANSHGDGNTSTIAHYQEYSCNDSAKKCTKQGDQSDLIVSQIVNTPGTSPVISGTAATPDTGKTDNQAASDKNNHCNLDGIGWILCPTFTLLGGLTDKAFSMVEKLLIFDGSIMTYKSTYYAWGQFRSIANILFVLVFLVIIYSQITGYGLSNYGLKRLLPRLVIIAILVNISYWICALMVDASNLLGANLKSFIDGIGVADGGVTPSVSGIGDYATWAGVMVLALIGGVALLFAISAPILLLCFISIILTVTVLMVRQALILLLIIVSPIAFVLFLLPSTEQWFKRWWKTLFSLLLLYPIIALVVGSSSFAGKLLLAAGSSGGALITGVDDAEKASDDSKALLQVIALGITAIPLFLVPSLLRNSLNATGEIGAKLGGTANSFDAKMKSGGKAKLKQRYDESAIADIQKERQSRASIDRKKVQGGVYSGKNPLKRGVSQAYRRLNSSRAMNNPYTGDEYGYNVASEASMLEDELFEKGVKRAQSEQGGWINSDNLQMSTANVGDTITLASGKTITATKERIHSSINNVMTNNSADDKERMMDNFLTRKNTDSNFDAGQLARAAGQLDKNIYGNNARDEIMSGTINSLNKLHEQMVNNSKNKLRGEHLVGSSGATALLQRTIEASGDVDAIRAFKLAADEVRQNDTLSGRTDTEIRRALVAGDNAYVAVFGAGPPTLGP